jgi:hypothetical protein
MARVPLDKREKIAKALKAAKASAVNDIVKSTDLSETDHALLKDSGWLFPIHAGYSLLTSEDARNGDTVHAHLAFGKFLSAYLPERMESYVLSPLTSLEYAVRGKLPSTVIVENDKSNQTITGLPGDYCIVFRKTTAVDRMEKGVPIGPETIKILPTEEALACLTKPEVESHPDIIIASLAGADPMTLSEALVRKKNQSAGSVLISLLSGLGRETVARRVRDAMENAGLKVASSERKDTPMKPKAKEQSISYFIRGKWHTFSEALRPKASGLKFTPQDIHNLTNKAQDDKVQDAYHSLSIEKYTVSEELISAIANGKWDPEAQKHAIDAMAAKGYLDAFNFVTREAVRDAALWKSEKLPIEDSIEILSGLIIGIKRRLFTPMAEAGLISASDIESYRNHPVFIRGSNHIPMNYMKVADAMQGLVTATAEEENPYIRAALAHFFLGFIHPFGDGNGRTSRFVMNYLRLVAGLPWLIVPVERRSEYLSGMEQLSMQDYPVPFFEFLLSLENDHP